TSTPWMTLRGIEANNTGTVQADSGIGIYVDGVYVARASGQVFDLADVQQIEVLRGPQGRCSGATRSAAPSTSLPRTQPASSACRRTCRSAIWARSATRPR